MVLKYWSAAVSFAILNAVPATWLVTVPELPTPDVNVWPGKVTIIFAAAPTVSVKVPQVPLGFGQEAVPDSVILPVVPDVVPVGLTRRPLMVKADCDEPPVVTLNVTTVAVRLVKLAAPVLEKAADGAAPAVSHTNPLGTVRIIVPEEI